MVDYAVNDRIEQFLHKVPSLGLDIKPEKVKGGVLASKALEVWRLQILSQLLALSLNCCHLQ